MVQIHLRLLMLFALVIPTALRAEEPRVRYVSTLEGSVYAFVSPGKDFEGARGFCDTLTLPGKDPKGARAEVKGFSLLRLETAEERNYIHGRVFQRGEGLNQYTWAGYVTLPGTLELPSDQQYIFSEWNVSDRLQPWPSNWTAAFVCEARTSLRPDPIPVAATEGPQGERFVDDVLIYKGHVYVFAARGRTMEEAIAYCNGLERKVEGVSYPSFQVVQLEGAEERQKVHALVQKNGGAWTWAGLESSGGAGPAGTAPVFTQWDRPDLLTPQPLANQYSVVCESVGRE